MASELERISIQRATEQDANVLSDIGRQTFTQSYDSVIRAEELVSYTNQAFSIEKIRLELTIPGIVYFLANIGKIPCGYSKLEPTVAPLQMDLQNPVELVRLYVMPEWIGKQIGTRLIKETVDVAHDSGYCSCWLRVWYKNERAIRFYRNWDFREIGREPYYVGQCCETVLLMARSLK